MSSIGLEKGFFKDRQQRSALEVAGKSTCRTTLTNSLHALNRVSFYRVTRDVSNLTMHVSVYISMVSKLIRCATICSWVVSEVVEGNLRDLVFFYSCFGQVKRARRVNFDHDVWSRVVLSDCFVDGCYFQFYFSTISFCNPFKRRVQIRFRILLLFQWWPSGRRERQFDRGVLG